MSRLPKAQRSAILRAFDTPPPWRIPEDVRSDVVDRLYNAGYADKELLVTPEGARAIGCEWFAEQIELNSQK